jgi:hypothetical protein
MPAMWETQPPLTNKDCNGGGGDGCGGDGGEGKQATEMSTAAHALPLQLSHPVVPTGVVEVVAAYA